MGVALDDWLAVQPDRGENEIVSRIFAQRPEWLALGDLRHGVLCRFDPSNDGAPVILERSEITFRWGGFVVPLFYEDCDEPPAQIAEHAIKWVEGVLNGSLALFTTRNTYGGGDQGLVEPTEVPALRARAERYGYAWSFQRWTPEGVN